VAKAWIAAGRGRAGSEVPSPLRARTSVGRGRVDSASETGALSARARRSFFWPNVTQQVARAKETIPFRDVSAAAACAGAVALWALALSLLAV
jgi:hypothetical protein